MVWRVGVLESDTGVLVHPYQLSCLVLGGLVDMNVVVYIHFLQSIP
jgi:hypothetical protein